MKKSKPLKLFTIIYVTVKEIIHTAVEINHSENAMSDD